MILDSNGTIFYNGLTWSSDLTEANIPGVGLGPYFPPVYDTTACPIGFGPTAGGIICRLTSSFTTSILCATPASICYTTDGTFTPGQILYYDSALTPGNEITGYDFGISVLDDVVYTINALTGEIGEDTGKYCSG